VDDSLGHKKGLGFLFEKRSIASLIVFRIIFGLLALLSSLRFVQEGWIEVLFSHSFFFKYSGFAWVPVLSVDNLYTLFYLMIAASICITLGFAYRFAIAFFFLAFTYVDLMDASNYLNHHYLFSLLGFLLIFLPANRSFSLDAVLRPSIHREKMPSWCKYILLFQISIVYIFAGLAKINTDWLLHGMPLAVWLLEHQHLPLIGNYLAFQSTAVLFSWVGMLYDCTIVFFLLNNRTRPIAFLAVLLFHGMTAVFFNIGLFPLIMVSCSLLFFSDNFHLRLLHLFQGGTLLGASKKQKPTTYPITSNSAYSLKAVLPYFLSIYVLLQLILPIRHLAYTGDTQWTEEGYRFSWRVMLVEKSGMATFHAVNPSTGQKDEVNSARFLSDFQIKQMAIQPEFIHQFAQFLKTHYQEEYLWDSVEIYVDSHVALNGRVSRPLIDPKADLLKLNQPIIQQYAERKTPKIR